MAERVVLPYGDRTLAAEVTAPTRWLTAATLPHPVPVPTLLAAALDEPVAGPRLERLVAAVGPLLADGGTIVLVAPCGGGVGPLDIVNHGIYHLGLAPPLPVHHRIVLVSELPRSAVEETCAALAPDLAAALADADELLMVPEASKLVIHAMA